MKILHTVEKYHPSVGGMQEVVRQISRRLAALGHEVTVATSQDERRKEQTLEGVKIAQFDLSGNAVRGIQGEKERYQQFLLESDFDVMTNFAAQQWATDLALPILQKIKAKKVFVPTGFSGLFWPQYHDYFEKMKDWMGQYDMNVFLSDDYRDVNFAKKNGIVKRRLIPNGAGEDEFLAPGRIDIGGRLGILAEEKLILHVGSHTGSKGHAEAIEIFKKAKIKNAVLLIVGNRAGRSGCQIGCRLKSEIFNRLSGWKEDGKRILVRELDRPETVAAYRAADLFLFPSNIECSPIVLFECLASRTAFLSSDVGNAREIVSWSGGGLILPTDVDSSGKSRVRIKESVRMLEQILSDRPKRLRMEEAGFSAWRERFSWKKIAEQYEKLYFELSGN